MSRFRLPRRGDNEPDPEPPEPDPEQFLEMLVDALRLAALPADQQMAVLPDFVHVLDEIALQYDDAWRLVPQIRQAGLLSDEQHEALARLDRHLEEMSNAADKDSLWTIETMEGDERWETFRRLAGQALAALGREPGRPSLEGTTWVSASETGRVEPPN
jgi:hypothetical protein